LSATLVLRKLRDTKPTPAALIDGGVEASVINLVDAIDGAERALLLRHLAQADPDLVEAGVAWLGEYHEAARERQRVGRNSKSKERRRRRAPKADEVHHRRSSDVV
jgi:hypothetical protein